MKRSKQNGFTLIEIIIALAILSIMVTVAYKMLQSVIESKDVLDDARDGMFIGNSVLNRLSREFQLAESGIPLLPSCDSVSGPAQNNPSTAQTSPTPAQVSGINLVGEEKSVDSGRGDTITFVAKEAGQYVPDGGTHTGRVQITYRVEKDPDQSGNKDQTYLLIRDEMPYQRPVKKACESAIHFPITKDLLGFELNYFNKRTNEWSTAWGSGQNIKLPSMIQFTVRLRSPDGQIMNHTTAVALKSEQ